MDSFPCKFDRGCAFVEYQRFAVFLPGLSMQRYAGAQRQNQLVDKKIVARLIGMDRLLVGEYRAIIENDGITAIPS